MSEGGITSQQLLDRIAGKADTQYKGQIQIKLPDNTVEEIAQWHNPHSLVNRIYKQNQIQDFTSVMLIGGMGSGKTTLCTMLAHELHKKGNYVIKWFGKEDIREIDKIFEKLPPAPHVLIFDDVSKALEGMPADRKRQVIQALTEVRHDKGRQNARKIITVVNVHYMMSFEKFWRSQGGIKIFTDIQREELNNINQMTKGIYARKLESFLKICDDQFTNGKFTVSLTERRDKEYITNKPFRFAMVLDRKGVRFFLFYLDGCVLCNRSNKPEIRNKVDEDVLVDVVLEKKKRSGIAILRHLVLTRGYRQACSDNHYKSWCDIVALCENYDVDWEKLANAISKKCKVVYSTRKPYRPREKPNDPSSKPKEQVVFIDEVLAKSKAKLNVKEDIVEN